EMFRKLDVQVVIEPAPAAVQGFGGGLLRASLPRRAAVAAGAVAPYSWRLSRLLRRGRVEILPCHDARGLPRAGPPAPLARVPALWPVRGALTGLGRLYLHACGLLARRILFVADAVVPTVPARYRDKFVTVYDGIAAPAPARRSRADLLATLPGARYDDLLVAAIGTVIPLKGAHHLVAAARLLRERDPRLRFVFVGDSPDAAYADLVRAQIARDGLGDRVHLVGWDDEPGDWFRAADIVALSTVAHETLAIAGQERVIHGHEGT